MKKQVSKSVGVSLIAGISITGLVLILSYKPHMIEQEVHDSTIDEIEINTINNKRIMPLIDEELQQDYETFLLEQKKQNESESQLYKGVKSSETVKKEPKKVRECKSSRDTTKKQKPVGKVKKQPMNRWNISLSQDEINLLANIVWLESRGESEIGQKAVCEVILNRMKHTNFEGTLYEILSARNQFSSWGSRNNAHPTDETYKIVKQVLNGKTQILSKDYVYFSTSPRNNKGTVKIGNHYFCKY